MAFKKTLAERLIRLDCLAPPVPVREPERHSASAVMAELSGRGYEEAVEGGSVGGGEIETARGPENLGTVFGVRSDMRGRLFGSGSGSRVCEIAGREWLPLSSWETPFASSLNSRVHEADLLGTLMGCDGTHLLLCHFMYVMAGYAFFLRTSKEPTFEGFFQSRFDAKQKRLMKDHNFDLGRYEELRKACYPYSSSSSSELGNPSSAFDGPKRMQMQFGSNVL
ncbi:hypothetical protein M0R45_004272 [Rubus argutus]|uniref:Calcium uniporter protein C-terminal domain-containing protein n=1 Tax=Rubus argutus TaxID=59490 RepID=A0AAW1YJB8_RUBAR